MGENGQVAHEADCRHRSAQRFFITKLYEKPHRKNTQKITCSLVYHHTIFL